MDVTAAADQLRAAELLQAPVAPLSEQIPDMNVADAYAVQQHNIARRIADGAVVRGHKVGLTAKAMQELLGVSEPDYGHLLDDMLYGTGSTIPAAQFCAPRIEPEIAFLLKAPLRGPNVTVVDVLTATEAVAPALEIVDSRVRDWKITLVDTIADNASSAAVVVGDWVPLDAAGSLPDVVADLVVNGDVVDSGPGSAVLGDPAIAVAWLANALAGFDVTLEPGHVVMPGSCTSAPFVHAGDKVEARFTGLGSVSVTFS